MRESERLVKLSEDELLLCLLAMSANVGEKRYHYSPNQPTLCLNAQLHRLVTYLDRDEAEQKLVDEPAGTFLIRVRLTETGPQWAISIRYQHRFFLSTIVVFSPSCFTPLLFTSMIA